MPGDSHTITTILKETKMGKKVIAVLLGVLKVLLNGSCPHKYLLCKPYERVIHTVEDENIVSTCVHLFWSSLGEKGANTCSYTTKSPLCYSVSLVRASGPNLIELKNSRVNISRAMLPLAR